MENKLDAAGSMTIADEIYDYTQNFDQGTAREEDTLNTWLQIRTVETCQALKMETRFIWLKKESIGRIL